MKRSKLFAALASGVAFSVLGFTATASAQSADDVAIIVENVPDAVDTLAERLQIAADNYQSEANPYPTAQLTFDLSDAGQFTANALFAGTEQFGSVGLGVGIFVGSIAHALLPYTMAFDEDPASLPDTIDPNDVATMIGNAPDAVAGTQPLLVEAAVELLQGNLVESTPFSPGVARPAAMGSTTYAVQSLVGGLEQGTRFQGQQLSLNVGALLLVPAAAAAPYVQTLEEGLAPAFDALAPVTGPIVAALTGV